MQVKIKKHLSKGHQVIDAAIEGLKQISLDDTFEQAVHLLSNSSGRIIVSGIGKSGHIARKIAASMASIGQPALFVHPTEAGHGDLGMIAKDDVLIVLSKSGENAELHYLIEYSKEFSIPIIAITANRQSILAKHSKFLLLLPNVAEACPLQMAPTTSTTMMLVIGDAITMALAYASGLEKSQFAVFHPAGSLGRRLKAVRQVMHTDLPLINKNAVMSDVLLQMSQKKFGCIGLLNEDMELVGIITDGDIRRNLAINLLSMPAALIMNTDPLTIDADSLLEEVMNIFSNKKITNIFVVENKKPIGLVHIHDLWN